MISMYGRLIRASLKASMQYKWNFLISSTMMGLLMIIDFIVIAVLLWRFDNIRGWNLYEIGLLYGTVSLSDALVRFIASEMQDFDKYIIQGEFDSLLVKPVSPLILLITRKIDISRLGPVFQASLIICFCLYFLSQQGQSIGPLLLFLPFVILCGMLVCFSLLLIMCTISFLIGKGSELMVFFYYAPLNAAKYPISLYSNWLKALFFSLIPVGYMGYLTFSYLLEKGGSMWQFLFVPVAVIAFFGLSISFWNYGIRHYHSTGQ
ncbi:ABC transporter permease [Brevibacillus daliensis]|uniref:ABC transporter permease n=1 Tax=Brevibacillus daliensis TaxID=2892995 RepID=UPI001E64278B|nr:ABC-2 family transporter protein [Brevibacillus daliensis]